MTFDSRDAYRKAVESLAWHTEITELDVARAAVALAGQGADHAETEDGRERHVGYYLLDAGLPRLKESIGYEAAGLQRLRDVALRWPTIAYLGSIALTSSVLLVAATIVAWRARGPGSALVAAALLVVPFVSVGVALTHRWTSRLLLPRLLPKLDFANGVAVDCRTAVVIPGLVEHPSDFDRLLAQLELHYLSCPDPALVFAVLTDHVDSSELPDDTELLASARKTVDALNAKYGSAVGGPFHVLHRRSSWNEGERSFMGWERKRGKLEELNRLLRGDMKTSYCEHLGAQEGLERIRFVLTLDADTQLPVGTARRLIGLAAHPLNAARFEPSSGRVVCGYTVVQPRVEPSPVDGVNTLFGRLWCGDTALDIYSSAASDVYQDLFGAGAYVGKGIYEIDTFMRSLEGRAPSNAIASHDLFEGIHGRAALATDIVVFEQYPQSYLSFLRRMHRWLRGDWQLLPWLLPRVPSADGGSLPNRLSAVDRWKIVDNLRRSLLAPCILALFFAGWALLPPVASALILAPLVVPLTLSVRAIFAGDRRRTLGRWLLGVVFMPVEAAVAIDAIVRALFRMTVTRKNLLQWVTAADAARTFSRGSRSLFWREMGTTVAVTTMLGIVLGISHPWALPFAAPLILAWLVSPEIARWASAPETTRTALEPREIVEVRRLARRTWLFFETFVGPTDQWLAPDNFQESPGAVVAHRTSPTNIGLMLVAELSAYDLGYIGRAELAALVSRSLDTLDRLERYRGHWLNWYDTRTLEPLLPRYVSTVDSGNLAGALVVMAEGCRQAAHLPAVRPRQLRGLGDALDLLADSLLRLSIPHDEANEPLAALRETLERAVADEGLMGSVVGSLTTDILRLEAALLGLLARVVTVADVAIFREVQTWLERFRHQTRSLDGDLATRAPDGLRDELLELARRIDAARAGIDFAFLFDPERKLFHIGYNATSDRLDANHYDLLASEARLASFLAIVQGEVPSEHWLTLGRPVTRIRGHAALLSWGGTMFEFLMPTLFMRSQDRTLLQQTSELVVAAQIAHGERAGLPWGVSESGYAHLDAQGSYQYRSFGVPGLGLRRGLEEDSVVAPYACVLGLRFRPSEVLENVARLEKLGARGLYGLYEAVDYDELRAKEAARATKRDPADHAIVRSYMAHHQGMILAALNNALNDDVLVDRFHSDPRTRIGEALLSERVPSVRLAEELVGPKKTVNEVPSTVATYPSWTPDRTGVEMAVLGNGRLLTVVTDTGAGYTSWNGVAITREGLDSTCDVDGTWIYLRDEESGLTWSAAPAPTRPRLASDEVLFSAHRVELHHGDEGVSVRTQISVSPHDDVEVRTVKLHNEGTVARTLLLMTYADPVLEPAVASAAHLAFSRLFVECERLPKQHGLLASRRLRNPDDPTAVVVQRLVWDDPSVTWLGDQTDRRAFVGRRRDARSP
ncbi:MAG: glucoamylase family protein, partial [Polyangiaceae bacterium]